jgi:predicted PhzF superfamily epimerase YddE/YHI9
VTIFQVDAFTDRPFAGNPAGVCVLPSPAEPAWMQAVAAEMNLSETAFLEPRADGGFGLRWFTPTVEVDLCGHATLAAAYVLWTLGRVAADASCRFETKSGPLTAARRGDWIDMDFPAKPTVATTPPPGLLEGLGAARPRWVGRNQFDYLVELDREDGVRALAPDHAQLRALPVRGVIVTARASGPFDFVSRFFAPGSGIDEDPVTGSAHCALAPYWGRRLDKTEMTGFQASPRGGVVRTTWRGDRVTLSGQAVLVFERS